MNLKQAKALKVNDHIIFDATFYKFLELVFDQRYFLVIQNGNCHPEKWEMQDCQMPGDYRGSFDSSIYPPKTPGQNYSLDVFIIDESNGIYCGFYSYEHEKWVAYGEDKDSEIRFTFFITSNIKWCFVPTYLKI